jgi:hypothetical protein
VAAGGLTAVRERAGAMLERVASETRGVLDNAAAVTVRAALAVVLESRAAALADDHDPRLLHPARTIRILIADSDCRSADALAAAAFAESVDAHLALQPGAGPLRALLHAVPTPGTAADDELLECIVTADHDVALIALAERLDHARHLHLRPDLDPRAFHAQVRAVYASAARRFSPRIARRFEHWADAFERRLILPG